jgi:hypothetical protein
MEAQALVEPQRLGVESGGGEKDGVDGRLRQDWDQSALCGEKDDVDA